MPQPQQTILIVEDDPGVAQLQSRRLCRAGYRCLVAASAEEGLAAVERDPIDLILLDYRLPNGVTGFDFYERLNAAGRQIPVIIVTGYSQEAVAIKALRAGMRDYVSKSVEYLDYLPEAVQRVLQQVKTERRLSESEARFHAFMDHSPAVAVMKDAQGRILYANRAFQERMGLRPEQWKYKTNGEIWPGKFSKPLDQHDRQVLDSGDCTETEETIPGPDGEVRQWMVYRFPVHDTAGETFLGSVAVDVTQKKLAERTLRKVEEQLWHSQKLEAMGRLAGGLAHDFNNILSVILGYCEMLLDDMYLEDPHREQIQEIDESAQRAAGLTRQLLTFSRHQPRAAQILDLNGVVTSMQKMLQRLLGKEITFRCELSPSLSPMRGDPAQVEQVLMNLVINARDAMPNGGSLVITTRELELGPDYCRERAEVAPGRYLRLTVSDTGCGMSADVQAKIFEPFFSTKDSGKGTGLGLATVYGIVRQTGGHIDVSSAPGLGTTFDIYFPVCCEPGEAFKASEGMADGASRNRGTVLLAICDPQFGNLLRQQLELAGYAVLTAANEEDAIVLAARHVGPIMLLITELPRLGPSEPSLAEQIAAVRPETATLFIADQPIADASQLRGAFYLQRPFTRQALMNSIRQATLSRSAGKLGSVQKWHAPSR